MPNNVKSYHCQLESDLIIKNAKHSKWMMRVKFGWMGHNEDIKSTLQMARSGPGLMVRVYLPRVPG